MIETGSFALRMMCIALLFLPTIMLANMTFQSIGKSGMAFFFFFSQNGLLFIPLISILPKFMGITGIELAQPLSYVLATAIALPFLIKFSKSLTDKNNREWN